MRSASTSGLVKDSLLYGGLGILPMSAALLLATKDSDLRALGWVFAGTGCAMIGLSFALP
jgi:hypothetical protein